METTLNVLPGEGDEKTVHYKQFRCECEICGEPAHYRLTFLLHRARSNPASQAYKKDNCSWCSDLDKYACKEHERSIPIPDGYGECSTFPASEKFAHMFLNWEKV